MTESKIDWTALDAALATWDKKHPVELVQLYLDQIKPVEGDGVYSPNDTDFTEMQTCLRIADAQLKEIAVEDSKVLELLGELPPIVQGNDRISISEIEEFVNRINSSVKTIYARNLPKDDPARRQSFLDRIILLQDQLRKTVRRSVDCLYLLKAYHDMLGPRGREVAAMWQAKKIARMHFDWTPDALKHMTGEERAEYILELESLPKRHVDPAEIDAHLPPSKDIAG